MIVGIPLDPPRSGLVLQSLVETTPVTDDDATRLYEAAAADVLRAAAESGGDVLVNYRDAETLPEGFDITSEEGEAEARSFVRDVLGDDSDVRFERQVGSTRAARIGNTVTHLLDREGATSVGIVEPTAPLVARTEIDSAAMSLRRYDAVFGPSTGGDVYFASFNAPIDFTDAFDPPAFPTLVDGCREAGLDVGFVSMLPTIETECGLVTTIAGLRARLRAGRPGGEVTTSVLEELELSVGEGGSIER